MATVSEMLLAPKNMIREAKEAAVAIPPITRLG